MKKTSIQILLELFLPLVIIGFEKEPDIDQPGKLVLKTMDKNQSIPSISINGTKLWT